MEMANNKAPVRVIFPKKGRLADDFGDIAGKAGIQVEKKSRQDFGTGFDVRGRLPSFEVLVQRPGDALACLDAGVAQLAVVGRDRLQEAFCEAAEAGRTLPVSVRQDFGLSVCSLCIAGPAGMDIRTPRDLAGMTVATSYPCTLRAWLADKGVEGVKVVTREGGLEDTIRLGIADVICDIVDTGNTLRANGLVPYDGMTLLESSAVLVQRDNMAGDPRKAQVDAIAARLSQASPVQRYQYLAA